jgi:hypothetical protein
MADRLRQAAAAQSAAPPPPVPRSRFNAAVSGHRVVDGLTFDLDDIRAVRPGAGLDRQRCRLVDRGRSAAYLLTRRNCLSCR